MPPQLLAYKPEIDALLTTFLARKKADLTTVNTWGTEAIDHITTLVTKGKTVRGALTLLTHDIFGADNRVDTVYYAAGIELIHTGLLIHDDIMDADTMRRGMPTLHTTKGPNIAMATGDLAFFLAYELFTEKYMPTTAHVIRTVSSELSAVCAAQMQDVAQESIDTVTEEAILSLYRYKTARYTFSLPMLVGTIVANAPVATQKQLGELGEHIGILFQIRDDELNASGDSTVSGKSTGSDAQRSKKTLATVSKNIEEIKKRERAKAHTIIDALTVDEPHKQTLRDMLIFVCERNK